MPTDHEEPCGPSHRSFCLIGEICYMTVPSPSWRRGHLQMLRLKWVQEEGRLPLVSDLWSGGGKGLICLITHTSLAH
uniref:Uncharacterized protein n=1 Tax=Vombatus ursinus TaxID=29139 RepID=A0A4X2LPY8_VOMUR